MFKKGIKLEDPLEVREDMGKMAINHEVQAFLFSSFCLSGNRSMRKLMLLELCISSTTLKTRLFASFATSLREIARNVYPCVCSGLNDRG